EAARPDAAPVHALVGAAREGILARAPEVALRVEILEVGNLVEFLDADPGVGLEDLLLGVAHAGGAARILHLFACGRHQPALTLPRAAAPFPPRPRAPSPGPRPRRSTCARPPRTRGRSPRPRAPF